MAHMLGVLAMNPDTSRWTFGVMSESFCAGESLDLSSAVSRSLVDGVCALPTKKASKP